MSQRQEREHDVVVAELERDVDAVDLGERVGVREHDPLGHTRGARRVDEGEEVVGLGEVAALLEEPGVGPLALLDQLVEREDEAVERHVGLLGLLGVRGVEDECLLELGQPAELGPLAREDDLLPLVEVLAEHVAAPRVVQDVAHLVVAHALVDRDDDRRGARDREVGEDPLDPALRQDRDALAGLEAQLHGAVRDPPGGVAVALPRHVLPRGAVAAPERGAIAALGGIAEELVDRGRASGLRGSAGGGRLGQHDEVLRPRAAVPGAGGTRILLPGRAAHERRLSAVAPPGPAG